MKNRKSKRGASSRTVLLLFWAYVVGSMLFFRFLSTASPSTAWTIIAALGVVAVCGETWRRLRARRRGVR